MADTDDFHIVDEDDVADEVDDRQVEAVFTSHMPPKPAARSAAVTTPLSDVDDSEDPAAGARPKSALVRPESGYLQSQHIESLVKMLRASLAAPRKRSPTSRPSTAVPAARAPAAEYAADSHKHSKRPMTASAAKRPASAITVDSIRERRASSPVAQIERKYHRDIVNMKRETFRAAIRASEALYGVSRDEPQEGDAAAHAPAATTTSAGRPPTGTTRSRPSTAAASRPNTAATSRGYGSRPVSAAAPSSRTATAAASVRPFSASSAGATFVDPVSTLGTAQVIPVKRYDEDRMVGRTASSTRPPSFFEAFQYRGIDDFLRHQKQVQHAPYIRAAATHDHTRARSQTAKSSLAKNSFAAVQYIHDYVAALGPLSLD